MKTMIRKYLPFVILTFVPFYGYTQSYNSSDWMNDKPFQDLMRSVKGSNSTSSTSPTLESKVKDKVSWAEREEERQYNNRLNEIKNNPSDLLWYMNKDEYSSIIMSNSELREKLKEKIWENIRRVIDLTKNPDIKKIVMDDPMLREYYELEVKKQDMRDYPESAIKYIKDPQITEVVKDDPELAQILAQSLKKKAEEEQRAEEQRLLRKKQEEERKELARLAEIKRLQEEAERANEQEEQNKQKRNRNKQLSDKILLELSPKQTNVKSEPNHNAESIVPRNPYNDFFDDPTLFQAKLNCAVYNTETELLKALRNAPTLSEYVSGETEKIQNKVKGKLISIPLGKINETADIVLNTGWPGANIREKARVSNLVRKEEENFVSDVIKCVAYDAVEAVSSGDMNKFNECIQQARETFVDQLKSNIDELTHVKVFGTIRKYKEWLTKTDSDDEEY